MESCRNPLPGITFKLTSAKFFFHLIIIQHEHLTLSNDLNAIDTFFQCIFFFFFHSLDADDIGTSNFCEKVLSKHNSTCENAFAQKYM